MDEELNQENKITNDDSYEEIKDNTSDDSLDNNLQDENIDSLNQNDNQEDLNDEDNQEDLNVNDNQIVTQDNNVKQAKHVKLSTTIISIIIAVLISLIVGTQICFIAINSVYEKKYEAYLIDRLKEASEKSENSTQKPDETENPIVSIIENITSLYDKHYIYENRLYDETYLSRLVQDYISLTGDKYGFYYTKDEWEQELKESKGDGYGIGIYYNSYNNDEGIYVLHVMKNTPAEEAGLQSGDIIIKIDGDYISENYDEIVSRLKGEKDESITITVLRDTYEFEAVVSRREYDIETVIYDCLVENNQKIAYIRIMTFDAVTVEQFRDALNKSKEDECTSIVFDLRDNLGGEINSLVQMLDMILPEGPILYFLDLDGNVVNEYTSTDSNRIVECPMVVLVNSNTASSSEAFSSALRDYKLAKLVGEHTYGKGCILSGYYTNDGGVLYLTTMLYRTAYSECFDNVGLTPDIVVEMNNPMNLFKVKYEDDVQLQEAIRILIEETNQ